MIGDRRSFSFFDTAAHYVFATMSLFACAICIIICFWSYELSSVGNNPELSCDKNMHTYYGLLALSSFLCSIWLAIVTCALANICACGGGSERGLICMVIISPLVLGLFFVLSLVIGTVWTFGGDCEAASPSVFKASATLTVCSWVGITLGWPLCAGSTLFVGWFLDFLSNSKRDFVERHQPISSYLDDDELYDLVDTKANRNNRRHSYYPQSEVDRESFDPRMDSYNQFLIRADNDSLASFSEVSFSYSNNRHTHQYSDNNSTNNSTQHIEGSKRIDVKRMGRHGYGKGKDRTDSEDDNDKHLDFTFDDDDDDMSTNDVSVSESTGINPSRHADYSSVDVVTVTYQSPKKQRKSLSPSSSRERHWKTGTWVWPWRVHNSETKGEGKGRRGRRVERYITSASAPLRKSSSEPSLQALMKHGAIRKIYTYISRDSGSNRRGGGGRQGRTRDSDVDGDSDAEYRFDDSDYDDLMYNVDEDSMLWPDEDSFGRHHSPDPGHSFRSGGRQRGSRRSMFGGISSYINPRAWTLFHWVATMSGGVLGLALVGFIYHLFKPV